jgi:hypothetical protein
MARPVVKSGSLHVQGSGGIATTLNAFFATPRGKMEITTVIGRRVAQMDTGVEWTADLMFLPHMSDLHLGDTVYDQMRWLHAPRPDMQSRLPT